MRLTTTTLACILILGLSVVPAPAAAVATNLVPNPSFESKTPGATNLMPSDWVALTPAAGIAFQSSVSFAEGAFSLGFIGGPRVTSGEVFWVRSAKVAFSSGCPATFSFRSDVISGSLQGAVEYFRADGSWIRSDILPRGPTADWTTSSVTVYPPSQTAQVDFTFAVIGTTGVVAHIDDVRFVPDSIYRFCESWEGGISGWWQESGTGATQDCARATDGNCSLRLAVPTCCGEYVRVSKNLSLPVLATQTVSFDFQGSSTSGDRNALIQLRFDGAAVNVDWTYGGSCCNNGLNIINYDQPGQTNTISWSKPNNWYRVIVTINGATHQINATMIDLSTNATVGSTTSIGFVGTTLQGISVQQVMWSGSSNTHHVDRIRIT